MTNKISSAAQARQKAARESDGTFGNQLHEASPVTLSGPAGNDAIRSLHDFADAQPGSTEGRGLANQARLSAAARIIHEGLPEAASFTLDKADDGYVVARAWDSRGYKLGRNDREYIMKNLREAGVGYIHAPVGLAEARKWEPDTVSPTSPKITSKGRTVFVTLPDGVVVDRTSKTNNYTHAIIASPEDTEVVRKLALVQADEHQKEIDDIDAALAAPLKIRSVQRFKTSGDPDVDRQGNPVYYNHEYRAYAADGKTVLKTIRGNSKQETQGAYDEDGKYHPDRVEKIFPAMKAALKDRRSTVQGFVDKAQATVDEIDNGTYNAGSWAAWGFSASAANAEKTARSNGNHAPARRFSAVEIDK